MIALALIATVLAPTLPPVAYLCNGTTVSYVIPWPYLANSHVVVSVTSATNAITPLSITTDYTVTPAVAPASGTLKLVPDGTKCPSGSTLTINRVLPFTQPQSFRTGSYQGAAHEQAFDRLEMQIQQIEATAANATTAGLLSAADWNRFNQVVFAAQNQFQAPFTGAVVRTIGGKLSDFVSVLDFTGVKGDGINDDTAGIQTALNQAVGRILIFPPGTYKLTAALNITAPTGLTLRGRGATLATNQQVVFQFAGNSANVTFDGLKLSSSEVSSSGVLGLITSLNKTISNIKVIDCDFTAPTSSTDGVKIDQTTVGTSLVGLEISGSRFTTLGMMGVEIINHTFDNISRYEQVRIVNNRFDGLGKSAIYGQAVSLSGMGKNNVVSDNTIQDATDIAIEIVGPWQTLVANNVLRNLVSGTTGLYAAKPLTAAAKPQNVSFIGNIVESNNGFAFQPSGINIGTISGNVITGTGKVSIEANDFLSISGNTFDVTNAVVITGCTYITASGNRFASRTNVTGYNPSITNTTFSTFSGSTFQSERSAGLLVNGASANNSFVGCIFSNESSPTAGSPLQLDGAGTTGNFFVAAQFRRTSAGGTTWSQTTGAAGNYLGVMTANTVNPATADVYSLPLTLATASNAWAQPVSVNGQFIYMDSNGRMRRKATAPTADLDGSGVGLAERGTITLTAGSATTSVTAGTSCVCTDTTANASVKCVVSGTTLTLTGTGTDVIAYACF